MKIELTTLFDCLIEVNGQKYVMDKCMSKIDIECLDGESIFVVLYPIKDKNLLSYSCYINVFDRTLKIECPYVKIINICQSEYRVEFLPFKLYSNLVSKIIKSNVANYDMRLIVGEKNYVCLESGQEIYFKDFEGKVLSYSFFTVLNFPSVKVICEDCKKLFVFNTLTINFDVYEGDINVSDDQITIIENQNDIAKHARMKVISYDDIGKVNEISNELIYLKEKPQKSRNEKIIPYAFFEAIRSKNFALAKEYLGERLKDNISKEMLEEYFGDFDLIIPYENQEGYCNYALCGKENKIYKITIKNSKIEEIDLR